MLYKQFSLDTSLRVCYNVSMGRGSVTWRPVGSHYGYRKPSCAPTQWATPRDIIWVAGIFEGEGTTRYQNTEGVNVPQKGRWLPERLQALFGGGISQQREGIWAWHVTGARAWGFLQSIYASGLLSPRRMLQIERGMGGER